MSQNDRLTHDDRYVREEVKITRDETSSASLLVIFIVALVGLGLLYWAASSYWAGAPTSSTTIVAPAPEPAPTINITPAPDTSAPAPLNNEAAPAEPAPAPAPAPAP